LVDDAPRLIPLPWRLFAGATRGLEIVNAKALQGRATFPGLFRPGIVHARFKPMTYTNNRAKALLQWTPRYSLPEALRQIS
jgi:2-alkyl-3-oxoalkanoate reductase